LPVFTADKAVEFFAKRLCLIRAQTEQ